MLLEGDALRTINPPPNDKVHHLVNRPEILEIRVVVLGEYKIVYSLESGATKRGKGALLVLGEDGV